MFFMKNSTIYVVGQFSNFVLHLDELSQEYSYRLLNKDNNRYEIWHNDAMLKILILSREKDHLGNEKLEVQTVGSIDIFETLYTFLEWKRYRIDFESHIDKITLPIARIARSYIESQLTNQEADNQESDVIQQRLTRRGLPELPTTEESKPGLTESDGLGLDAGNDKPWEQIPDHHWDRTALEMYINGYPMADIASKVGVVEKRARNRITELRKRHGAVIPYRRPP